MVHVAKINIDGDPNIGLYCIASDNFCLVGKSVPKKYMKIIAEVFKVPIIQSNVYGTSLVGVFAVACKNILLLPDVIFENELNEIKSKAAEIGVTIKLIKTEHTALANNILCNSKKGILSSRFSAGDRKKITEALNLETKQLDLAQTKTPGSIGALTTRGAIFSSNLNNEEIKLVENFLGIEIGLGSVNMGSQMIGSGVVANSNGFLVGGDSSGYEIGRVEESLGFLKQ